MRSLLTLLIGLAAALALACGGPAAAPAAAASTATAGAAAASLAATVALPPAAVPPAGPDRTLPRLFPAAAAGWLYTAPVGPGLDISSQVTGLSTGINAHDGGFDYPVQYTDGSQGCLDFTDTAVYSFFTDNLCVPVPAAGFAPSTGGWGTDDGHLVVVDTGTGAYFDFWKLTVDATGQPTTTNVGQIVGGLLASSDGTPGTTAAGITGLAGDILPGELDCATCLRHALSVIVPVTLNSPLVGAQGPALKTDGTVAGGVFREGAKIALDPSVDVSSLTASVAAQAILNALQQYGGLVVDQTGANGIYFYSALPTSPDLTGLDQLLQHLYIFY